MILWIFRLRKKLISDCTYVIALTIAVFFIANAFGQCYNEKELFYDIESINKWPDNLQKLKALYSLKKRADSCKLTDDSGYVVILKNISNTELKLQNYNTALSIALLALKVNEPAGKRSSKILSAQICLILGHYYDHFLLFKKALGYYDSTIYAAHNQPALVTDMIEARLSKAYIYFRMGDFQKGIDESTLGLHTSLLTKDTISYIRFLNQRAQSFFYQNNLRGANLDLDNAIKLSVQLDVKFQLASAYKTKALIAAKQQNFYLAQKLFAESINQRILTKRYDVVASDYNDCGNFYRDSLHMYDKAKYYYFKAEAYALKEKDSARMGMINVNLTKNFYFERNYKKAEQNYIREIKFLKLKGNDNF